MIKILPQDPTIYLVNSNKSDPTQAPEGHENLKVLPHIPYIQNQPFTEEQYSDFRERVLDKLEKWGLQTYVNISYMKIFGRHTILNTYGSNKGAIYGVVAERRKIKGSSF